jgi:hypothetical protein
VEEGQVLRRGALRRGRVGARLYRHRHTQHVPEKYRTSPRRHKPRVALRGVRPSLPDLPGSQGFRTDAAGLRAQWYSGEYAVPPGWAPPPGFRPPWPGGASASTPTPPRLGASQRATEPRRTLHPRGTAHRRRLLAVVQYMDAPVPRIAGHALLGGVRTTTHSAGISRRANQTRRLGPTANYPRRLAPVSPHTFVSTVTHPGPSQVPCHGGAHPGGRGPRPQDVNQPRAVHDDERALARRGSAPE